MFNTSRLALAMSACLLFLAAPPSPSRAQDHSAHRRPELALGVAYSPDGRLWVTGLDEKQRLFVQDSADDGRHWSPRRLLDTQTDRVIAQGESWPKIAFGAAGQAVISYAQPLAKPYTGEIRMLRSEDGGRSFSPPFTVHADRQIITHRFDSIAFDATGALHVLWIDKRDAEADRAAAKARGDKSTYRGAAIYRVVSTDGGRSFGPDTALSEHSCECCRIALAPDESGGIAAMWRHVFDRNTRDHGFARIAPAGAGPSSAAAAIDPVRATRDDWKLDACPHHGPGLAPAAAGGFHAVWFGNRAGRPAVRHARLTTSGEPDGPVRELPDERAEHADVVTDGPRVAIVWRSFDGQLTRLRAWVSEDDGRSFALRDLRSSAEENDFPRLARRQGHLVVVWRTAREVHVERL